MGTRQQFLFSLDSLESLAEILSYKLCILFASQIQAKKE